MRNTLLIIEDCPLYQASLQKLASDHGYSSQSCYDGMEAIVRLNQGADMLSAIFLDINMPNIDGISLLGHLHSKYPQLPVIVITGFDEDEHSEQTCLGLGADLYITKPLDDEKIQSIFSTVKRLDETRP